jgi:hypothetical protein
MCARVRRGAAAVRGAAAPSTPADCIARRRGCTPTVPAAEPPYGSRLPPTAPHSCHTTMSHTAVGILALAAVASAVPQIGNTTGNATAAKDCTGDCLMMKMMEEKRIHFA